MPPPQRGIIKPRSVIVLIQCIARQLVVLQLLRVVKVLVFGGVLAVEVLLLHGHPPELLGTGARIIARLLQQLGLAVAVGGKNYANVSQTRTERLVLSVVEVSRSVILHAVFIFPVSTVANIYGRYPHIAGKDSD